MTAPIWMAAPPEVHSTLLSTGPGPGPLLAAAAAWHSLSTEYAETAEELSALLAAVQTGAWAGPTAEAYLTAHTPYLSWLVRAGADSAAAAAGQQVAATAYDTALAAMPTLAELAANHATHAVLLATNFFGVNTIPIALNEADYTRMWIQAATVMSTYQAVSVAATAALPPSAPAPKIVQAHAAAGGDASPPPDQTDQVMQWLQQIGYTDFYNQYLQPVINALMENPYLQSLLSGFDPYLPWTGNPLSFFSPFNVGFALGYPMDISQFVLYLSQTFSFIGADLTAAFTSGNPATIGFTLIFTTVEAVGTIITDVIALLKSTLDPALALIPAMLPLLTAPMAAVPVAGLSGLSGLAGLAGLYAVPAVPVVPAVPPLALALAAPPPVPVAPAPAPAAVAAPASITPPPVPPPPPPAPPLIPVDAFSYLLAGLSADARHAASVRARKKVPTPDDTEAAAAAPAAEEGGPVRRRRAAKAEMLGRGYEYMDLEPTVAASECAAGPFGFTGTAGSTRTGPTGLTALADDSAGCAPPLPLLPGNWAG